MKFHFHLKIIIVDWFIFFISSYTLQNQIVISTPSWESTGGNFCGYYFSLPGLCYINRKKGGVDFNSF